MSGDTQSSNYNPSSVSTEATMSAPLIDQSIPQQMPAPPIGLMSSVTGIDSNAGEDKTPFQKWWKSVLLAICVLVLVVVVIFSIANSSEDFTQKNYSHYLRQVPNPLKLISASRN